MADTHNLIVRQGETHQESFTLSVDGVAFNLTGYTIEMQVRKSLEDSAAVLSASTATGEFALTDAVNGEFALTLAPAVTQPLVPGRYLYDLRIISAAGVVTYLLSGQFIVEGSVTR